MPETRAVRPRVNRSAVLRFPVDLDALAACVETLLAGQAPPCPVEVTLVRSIGQTDGYAWLGFATHHRAGWWERNGLAVRVPDLGAGRRIVVELEALTEAVSVAARGGAGARGSIEWRGDALDVGGRSVPARADVVPPVPDVPTTRDAVYLTPGDPTGASATVESEQGRLRIPAAVLAHLHRRGAAVAEFGILDGEVYVTAQADSRGAISAAPLIVAPVELLSWSGDASPEFRERRRGGAEVEQLLQALDPSTPSDTLLTLLDTAIGYVRRRAAAHPALPGPVADALAATGTRSMRMAVAANPSLTVAAIAALSRDPEPGVRAALAANPALDAPAVERLTTDADPAVRAAAAANPELAPEVRAALLDDPAPEVRCEVARRSDDPELLRGLAHDVEPAVCAAVASNPACPPEVLDELAALVPDVVLANPSAPTTLLIAGTRAADPQLRRVVAANPSTPTRALAALARDPDDDVVRALADNPSAPRTARRRAEQRTSEVAPDGELSGVTTGVGAATAVPPEAPVPSATVEG